MAELPILHPGSVAGSQAKEARPMFNTEKIIRLPTVLARTGLSRSTLYRKIAEGTFPAQVRISVHGAGWHESAVNRWIADPPGYRADNDNRLFDDGQVGTRMRRPAPGLSGTHTTLTPTPTPLTLTQ